MPEENTHDLTFEEQLDAYAVANEKAEIEKETPELIQVRIELDYKKTLKPLVFWLKPRTHKSYQIYGLGLEVYRKITTGHMKIRDLIYWLRDTYKLSFYEARNLILQFTGDLLRNGIIVIEAEGNHGSGVTSQAGKD